MKKRNILIGACVLVVAAGLWIALRPSEKSGITLETAPTERITIRNSVTATGTVEPVTEVEVGTQVSGIIDKLYADYNDVVAVGLTAASAAPAAAVERSPFMPSGPGGNKKK